VSRAPRLPPRRWRTWLGFLSCAAIPLFARSAAAEPLLPVRGVTIGPIESALHPGKGYASEPYARTLREVRRWGATWVSLTPFGRTLDLRPTGVALDFEAPFSENRRNVLEAVRMAHAEGLRVLLVPHLWVESGAWRAEIDPGDGAPWGRWASGYGEFVLAWAEVAAEAGADMFSVGVELRSWVTTARASSFREIVRAVRRVYPGPLTYSANWDDVQDTVVLGELDVIGVNAFYPLTDREGAGPVELLAGGRRAADKVRALARDWRRPVLFTEIGYTTRPDPALRPWEWPDGMRRVRVDQAAQRDAYAGLLGPLLEVPDFAGFFVWRVYADPDDASQEAEWGFSPRGKLAELVVRDAFAAHWAADGPAEVGHVLVRWAATSPGGP
jgi:hypothetical protein